MWRVGAMGSAIYTTATVAFDWVGAVIKKRSQNAKNAKKGNGDRLTDTDRPTDTVTYRVALPTTENQSDRFVHCLPMA